MKKVWWLTAVALLTLAACTSGDDDVATTDATTAEGPGSAELGPGVTDDTIKIGVTYVDMAAIKDITGGTDHGDYEASYRALIDDLNERGGIRGRTIEPVFAAVNPVVTQSGDDACLKLAQDEEVFAVIGFYMADGVLCFIDTHGVMAIGGDMTSERLARAKAPWFTGAGGGGSSDLEADTVKALAEGGALDGKVAIYALSFDQASVEDTVVPTLEEAGVEVVEVGFNDAPTDDPAALLQRSQAIFERFRASGADTVLAIGVAGPGVTEDLNDTSFRPKLVYNTSDLDDYVNQHGDKLDILDGAVGAGTFGPDTAWWETASSQACMDILAEAGIDVPKPPSEPVEGRVQHEISAWWACRDMALLEALLEAAGENLNYDAIEAAAEEGVEATWAGELEPRTWGLPPHADGDPKVYLFDWDADVKKLVPRT